MKLIQELQPEFTIFISIMRRNNVQPPGPFLVTPLLLLNRQLIYINIYCLYPCIPNYKTFWLFQIHSFCNALRYTLCLDYIIKSIYLEKPKMSDNLEWREQIIVPMYGKFTYEIPVVMNLLSILFHLLSGNYQGICNCTFPR